jgi:hypothetical protein
MVVPGLMAQTIIGSMRMHSIPKDQTDTHTRTRHSILVVRVLVDGISQDTRQRTAQIEASVRYIRSGDVSVRETYLVTI